MISDAIYHRNAAGAVVSIEATFPEGRRTAPAVAGNRHYDAVLAAAAAGDLVIGEVVVDPAEAEAAARTALVAYAAAARWQRETGGITVGGIAVATDRESQAMLGNAHAYLQLAPAATVQWKGEAGFVTLDAAAITGLAQAVGAHVQACFAAEADVVAQITAGTITDRAAIDAAFAAI